MSDAYETNANRLPAKYGPKATVAQVLATLAQSILLMGLGMEISVPAIVIQNVYKNANSTFSLTLDEISWYGSILYIFHPTGSFISGFLQERYGRKRCLIMANVPSVFGWITLYFTDSAFTLYASIVLMGLGIGFSEAPLLSYVGEITEPRLRGSMSSLASAAYYIGITCLFLMAYLFHWRTVALLSTLCPIACMSLVTLIPESPIWLISKGKTEKAERALCWLRGWVEPEQIKAEHLELVRYTETSGNNDGNDNGSKHGKLVTALAEFRSPSVYRPLRLLMIIYTISYVLSLLPARSFISKIFHDIGLLENQSLILVVLALLQNIGCVIVVLTIHRLGKRFMALTTYSINTILIFLLGLYVIGLKNNYITSTPWVPIAIMSGIYIFGACVNMLPWILVAELFPNKSRGVATGLCAGLAYLLMFVLTKCYISVELFLTLEYTLLLFGVIGIFGLIYLYFCLPETESKTLLEIEEFFS